MFAGVFIMKKRGLCLLLAVVTVFALAVPALASGGGLEAPTVTIAQAAGGIQVTWNAVDGSPRYMVYYNENNGGWKKIGTTTATSYTRAAKYLKNGAIYQFAVRCCANDKKSLLSPYKASNSLTYSAKLAAPTVTISNVTGGIQVTWNKIDGAPRYMVYYNENNSGWKKIGTTTATTYTRAAKYLKNGATYAFAVRCCANDKKTLLGPYKASNSLKYTLTLAAPTVTISNVSGGIKVSWNKIDGAPRYMVYYNENNGGWKKIGTTTATTYTRASKDLKDGATYQFAVRCCANDKKTLLGPYKASNSLKYTLTLAEKLFAKLPSTFMFTSGVGAWGSTIEIKADGSFTGTYHDTNMGESGPGYVATVYMSEFSGKFTNVKQVNDYTYSVQLGSLTYKTPIGTTKIVSEGNARVRYVYEDAYGLAGGKTFYFYTPDAPTSKLPDDFLGWVHWSLDSSRKNLGFYGLYNVTEKLGWFSEE